MRFEGGRNKSVDTGGAEYAGKDYTGLSGMQAAQLFHNEKQKE
jgi:hypothetical protein